MEQQVTAALQSGAPAAATSALLFSGIFRNAAKPSKLSCGAFGAAFGLGAFMIYDGDYKNGTGFVTVWGLLYSMVNGKQLLRGGGHYGRLTALTVLTVSGLYGREFMRTPNMNKEGLMREAQDYPGPDGRYQNSNQNYPPPRGYRDPRDGPRDGYRGDGPYRDGPYRDGPYRDDPYQGRR